MIVVPTKGSHLLYLSVLAEIDDRLVRKLSRLTFKNYSPMRIALKKYRRRFDTYVIWCEFDGKVLGWSLITPGRGYRLLRASFFVRPTFRGCGIGASLRAGVAWLAKNTQCLWGGFVYDDASRKFLTQGMDYDVYSPPPAQKIKCRRKDKYLSPWLK